MLSAFAVGITPSALNTGPVTSNAAIAIEAAVIAGFLQLRCLLRDKAIKPAASNITTKIPLLLSRAVARHASVNIGSHAFSSWRICPFEATKSKTRRLSTTIPAENRGSFHIAIV